MEKNTTQESQAGQNLYLSERRKLMPWWNEIIVEIKENEGMTVNIAQTDDLFNKPVMTSLSNTADIIAMCLNRYCCNVKTINENSFKECCK